MKAIIIDDETPIRKGLQIALKTFCPFVEVIGEAGTCQEAFELIQQNPPELIFLDIEMPDETGFDFLTRFEAPPFEVIFITGFDQYAIKAIKFSAVDYLLKPIDELELVKALGKVYDRINLKKTNHNSYLLQNIMRPNHQENRIAIPKANGYEFIPVSQIIRCEADRDNTTIYLENNQIYATKGLKDLYSLLEDYGFSRIHQSHIINLHKMERYFKGEGGYVKMIDQSTVDVSRRRKQEFLKKLKHLKML